MAALETLTTPAVLAFLLGVLAAVLRSDVRLPDAVHTAMSSYLLLAIGLKGGAGLRSAELGDVALPVFTAVVLGVVTPLIAWAGLRVLTRLGSIDRAAVSAQYGSTSLVTFTAARPGGRRRPLVAAETADALLEVLARDYFPHFAVVAWTAEVNVVRPAKFV